jgi:NADH-quinone oxidoreductase subunit K
MNIETILSICGSFFSLGLLAIALKPNNLLFVFLSMEVMILSLLYGFIQISNYYNDYAGIIMVICILVIAAGEAMMALGLFYLFYRKRGSVSLLRF